MFTLITALNGKKIVVFSSLTTLNSLKIGKKLGTILHMGDWKGPGVYIETTWDYYRHGHQTGYTLTKFDVWIEKLEESFSDMVKKANELKEKFENS